MGQNSTNLHDFNQWLSSLNKTRGTGWRWRKRGLIQTVDIFGRVYVSGDEIAKFEARATAGEFAKSAKPAPKVYEAARQKRELTASAKMGGRS